MNLMSALSHANGLELIAPSVNTTTATGTGVDVTAYEGVAVAVLDTTDGTGTTPTLDVKLQSCDTVGGTYADITGATFTQVTDGSGSGGVEVIAFVVANAKAFVRAVATIAGSTPEFTLSVTFLGMKKAVS